MGGRELGEGERGAAEHQPGSPLLTAVIRLPASHVTPTEAETQSRPATTAAAAAAAPCTLLGSVRPPASREHPMLPRENPRRRSPLLHSPAEVL